MLREESTCSTTDEQWMGSLEVCSLSWYREKFSAGEWILRNRLFFSQKTVRHADQKSAAKKLERPEKGCAADQVEVLEIGAEEEEAKGLWNAWRS